MTKYSKQYSVICSDIDMNSQMQPISTPVYFQDCFIRYAAKNNFATFDIKNKHLQWFISEYKIYLTENLPYWSENFVVETWISKISKLKVTVNFVFKHNGNIFAKGESIWLLFDTIKKQPALTEILFKDYDEIESTLSETIQKIQWENTKEAIRSVEHIANLTDLDFNEHINNRSYINMAITTASKEIQENYYIKQLAVKFLQQAFMGERLICTSYSTKNDKEYITNIKTTNRDICNIYTVWELKTHKHDILNCDLSVRQK